MISFLVVLPYFFALNVLHFFCENNAKMFCVKTQLNLPNFLVYTNWKKVDSILNLSALIRKSQCVLNTSFFGGGFSIPLPNLDVCIIHDYVLHMSAWDARIITVDTEFMTLYVPSGK